MSTLPKKSLAIFSLNSCEGCQFELLSFYDHVKAILNYYEIKNFRLGQELNLDGPYDVALIEGSPGSESEEKLLKKVRKESKLLIAIGACAHLGGIQSQRNRLPATLFHKEPVKNVASVVKVDFTLPGCPVSHTEVVKALLQVYWDKTPELPDLAVCYECRQNENTCLLKLKQPCLGPVTRGGCNAVCVNAGQSCFGCRGPLEQANFEKLKEIMGTFIEDKEIENLLTIYGDYEKEHQQLIQKD